VLHQELCDATLTRGAANEELCDLRAVRLVRRQREDHLHRADQLTFRERREQQPTAGVDFPGHRFERGTRLLVRERRHVADGCTSGDAVGKDRSERIELRLQLGSGKTADIDHASIFYDYDRPR
jgi:hypothetical protein